MIGFRPPATGTEARLEAILEELRGIRVLLGDRHLVRMVDEQIDERLDEVVTAVRAANAPAEPEKPAAPTKRTRTRAPRTTQS